MNLLYLLLLSFNVAVSTVQLIISLSDETSLTAQFICNVEWWEVDEWYTGKDAARSGRGLL